MEPIPINPRQSRESVKETSISPPPPQRTGSSSSLHKITHGSSYRQSFAENLRGLPASPRSQRHPSLTQSAIQDLLNHPPASRPQNPRFAGRDWRDIAIGELVTREDVKWVDLDTSVEDATMVGLSTPVQLHGLEFKCLFYPLPRPSSEILQAM